MKIPPRAPGAGLFSGRLIRHVTWVGVLFTIVALGVGVAYYDPANPEDRTWQTMIFTTLAFLQVGQALASRSSEESLFRQGFLSNPTLLAMIALVIALQLLAVYWPALEDFFGVVPLSGSELALCVALGTTSLVAIEVEKWILRRRN